MLLRTMALNSDKPSAAEGGISIDHHFAPFQSICDPLIDIINTITEK